MKLAIVVPSGDSVYVPFLMSLVALQSVLLTSPPVKSTFDLNIMFEQNSLLVGGRQNLAERALKWGADYVLMLDSDMKFPADVVHRLMKHNKPVVACNYVRRILPATPVTRSFDETHVVTRKTSTGLEKVKFTGFGVTLVHKGVFEKIPKPWFDTLWQKDADGNVFVVGEDVFFFEALRHFVGEDVYIDHDVSQQVGHIGTFEYLNRLAVVEEELTNGTATAKG